MHKNKIIALLRYYDVRNVLAIKNIQIFHFIRKIRLKMWYNIFEKIGGMIK
jgi:hypothetical protein